MSIRHKPALLPNKENSMMMSGWAAHSFAVAAGADNNKRKNNEMSFVC